MNIDYETTATAGLLISAFSFLTAILVTATIASRIINKWMHRAGKTYGYEVWFWRCILIFLFLAMYATHGFDPFTRGMAYIIFCHLAIENPWMVRHIERVRAEQKKVESK